MPACLPATLSFHLPAAPAVQPPAPGPVQAVPPGAQGRRLPDGAGPEGLGEAPPLLLVLLLHGVLICWPAWHFNAAPGMCCFEDGWVWTRQEQMGMQLAPCPPGASASQTSLLAQPSLHAWPASPAPQARIGRAFNPPPSMTDLSFQIKKVGSLRRVAGSAGLGCWLVAVAPPLRGGTGLAWGCKGCLHTPRNQMMNVAHLDRAGLH